MKKVLHNSYTMCTRGSPDIYTLGPRACGPQALGVYMRQTTRAHGITINIYIYIYMYYINILYIYYVSYNMVVLYSREQYKIIELSHSIKQPCSSVCLKKALEMHQKC